MKIAFITYEFPPFIIGGAGIYAKYLTKNLAERGHQVYVFSPEIVKNNSLDKLGIDNIETIKVKIYNKIPFKSIQFNLQLPKIVKKIEKKNNFDIIHFNGISYWFFKKRISKAPHIITIHHLVKDAIKSNNLSLFSRVKDITGETSFIISFIEKRCIKSIDRIISVSKFTKNQIVKTYGIPSAGIDVVYNGINSEIYNFTKKEIDEIRHRFKIDKKPVILFVGRVDDPRKDIDFLLRIFKKVTKKTDAVLLVVGSGKQDSAKIIVRSLKLSNDVIFTGFVDSTTLKKIYALCTLYVCSSRLEGFGLTIIEAMAAGKPIVATNVGAIPEIIKNNVNGILINPGDVDGAADAILAYLKDERYMKDVGKKNKIYVKKTFSWKKNAAEIEAIYEKSL